MIKYFDIFLREDQLRVGLYDIFYLLRKIMIRSLFMIREDV